MPGVFQFSQTAALNAGSDPTQNWAEGQAPSSINDSARSLLASIAKYRDDISGMVLTTGSAGVYAITSNQGFDTLANFHNKEIAFKIHATNTISPVSLTVDGFANLPLRSAPNVELLPGTLVAGTSYMAIYNNTDGALYLRNFFGASPFLMPLGGMCDFIGSTTPNSNFVFPIGQALSRTVYAALFALIGTTYGVGDGSTTFNVIDMTGRVGAMKEGAASRLTATYFGGNSTLLGAVGGGESHLLTTGEIPAHSHANTLTDPGHFHTMTQSAFTTTTGGSVVAPNVNGNDGSITTQSKTTGITITNVNTGGGAAHAIVQPTIIINKILRVI